VRRKGVGVRWQHISVSLRMIKHASKPNRVTHLWSSKQGEQPLATQWVSKLCDHRIPVLHLSNWRRDASILLTEMC
jgi:hypothetical protein